MWVAQNRQKPPEDNAFAKRAKMKRGGRAAEPQPEPAAEPVAKAVAAPFDRNPESAEYTQAPDLGTFTDLLEDVVRSHAATAASEEPGNDRPASRGRPVSSTVAERTARILQLVTEAGVAGISKPDLAAAVETKEANVQVALGKLKDAGKVESRRLPDTGKYRWFAV